MWVSTILHARLGSPDSLCWAALVAAGECFVLLSFLYPALVSGVLHLSSSWNTVSAFLARCCPRSHKKGALPACDLAALWVFSLLNLCLVFFSSYFHSRFSSKRFPAVIGLWLIICTVKFLLLTLSFLLYTKLNFWRMRSFDVSFVSSEHSVITREILWHEV